MDIAELDLFYNMIQIHDTMIQRTIYIYLFSVPQSFSLDIENASAVAAVILEDISRTNILIISRSYNIFYTAV